VVAGRQNLDDRLELARRLQFSSLIRISEDTVGVGDVEPRGILAGRVEGNAIGLIESFGENGLLRNARTAVHSEHANLIGGAVDDEEVAIGSASNDPWRVEVRGDHFDRESVRHLELGVGRSRDDIGRILRGLRKRRRRKVVRFDQAADSRRILLPSSESLFTGEQVRPGTLCRKSGTCDEASDHSAHDNVA
jgi:hypothetical protein